MKFEEALIELRKGKKIRPEGYFEYLSLKEISNVKMDTRIFIFFDWEVLEEPGKTFPEVFEALKEGKKIRRKGWDIEDKIAEASRKDLLATDWEIID